jgi:acetone carboxylase beta subunit
LGEVRKPVIVTCDAGGTMTDIFMVDAEGKFSVGKASTTPRDESVGFWESLEDAFSYWGIDLSEEARQVIPPTQVAVYTGTTILNTILQRRGRKLGVLITKGFEDSFTLERGFQKIGGYSYADQIHAVTHFANPPLVPKSRMKGITERIDLFGKEAIPLYEHEVQQAVRDLLDDGVEAIVIMFLFSFVNPSHEQAAVRVAKEVMADVGRQVPILMSHEVSRIARELPRLNSVTLQAYAAEPVREHLFSIEKRLTDQGFSRHLQTLLSYGGLADIRYPRLFESMVSGPVGGIIGAGYLGKIIGAKNVVAADLGGTSFDVGLITEGTTPITRESEFARFIINLPMLTIDSVSAGVGMYIRLDPATNRIVLGPESAGADPGPVCYDMGNEVPTIADCDLLLGILNPDYYLGGKLKLNMKKAYRAFKENIADPLHTDLYEAAEGIIRLDESTMREHIKSLVLARGYNTSDYALLTYGGAGPVHMAGFSEGLEFMDVITVPWAAAFSAFGCAAADYSHRYHKSVAVVLPPVASEEIKMAMAKPMNAAWDELETEALTFAKQEGFEESRVTLRPFAFVRYGGQYDDLEVTSLTRRINSPADFDQLIARFEDLYAKVYALGAKFPQGGFQIFEVGLEATVSKIKPQVYKHTLASEKPDSSAYKGKRRVYFHGEWHEATLFEMEKLKPGNQIDGLAIVEAPNTTLFVPPERRIRLDEFRVIHMH